MATIKGIKITDSEFTRMQELATAYVLKRAFKDNKKFNSAEAIIKDATTKKGLKNIFKKGQVFLFDFNLPVNPKTLEGRWLTTFFLQQKKLLSVYSNKSFTVFNRDGGFMEFISDLVKDKWKISKKDAWNPADIWLIKEKNTFRKKIKKQFDGQNKTAQTLLELNTMMRDMFKKEEIVGVSLKRISGDQAVYKKINIDESFLKKMDKITEGGTEYNCQLSKINCNLTLKDHDTNKKITFGTQDTIIFLKSGTQKDVAKFQIKGNTTTRGANLKFEGTEIGFSGARLGKAPLNLVQKLSEDYPNLYTKSTKDWKKYPTTWKEFNTTATKRKYEDIFGRLEAHGVIMGISKKVDFVANMKQVFGDINSHIANSKLQQMYFLDKLLQINEDDRDEYLTDLLFISQKQGRKVFDFGPFGKLY